MCKGLTSTVILALALCFPLLAGEAYTEASGIHFLGMDLWVDSGNEALAAYQVEINYEPTLVKIVGIEGGQGDAYADAPYYDQKGFESGRIIVAAFTIRDDAPKGRTRVARIHVAVEGDVEPKLICKLIVAAKPGGQRISSRIELVPAMHEKRSDEREKK